MVARSPHRRQARGSPKGRKSGKPCANVCFCQSSRAARTWRSCRCGPWSASSWWSACGTMSPAPIGWPSSRPSWPSITRPFPTLAAPVSVYAQLICGGLFVAGLLDPLGGAGHGVQLVVAMILGPPAPGPARAVPGAGADRRLPGPGHPRAGPLRARRPVHGRQAPLAATPFRPRAGTGRVAGRRQPAGRHAQPVRQVAGCATPGCASTAARATPPQAKASCGGVVVLEVHAQEVADRVQLGRRQVRPGVLGHLHRADVVEARIRRWP